ncbi:MAG: HAMP domain-containing protein [Sideroxydans sp.]|nr:HAMP domain-containing protein [Sideroxydans sp.]
MNLRHLSIQSRLILLILGSVITFGFLAGYESYKNALHEADETFDAQLVQYAQSLLLVATHTDEEQAEPMPPPTHKYEQTLIFQVWSEEHGQPRILLRSNNASVSIPDPVPDEGFSSGKWHGERWHYYREHDESRELEVLVGQNSRARNELAQKVAWHNIEPFLLGLPVLLLVATLAIRYALYPLRKLTAGLRQLSPAQLDPINIRNTPRELTPVIHALNQLLGRIANTIEHERRFTADASHELRTPLAALRAQIQAAQLTTDQAEQRECMNKATQGADRMAHLVEQLLTLSRLDEYSSQAHLEPVDLVEITRACCAEIAPDALSKNIDLAFTPEPCANISGLPDLLPILLRNLLDNAIRYTSPDGQVTVAVRPANTQHVELEISDNGSGVPDEQLALLGQRFSRLTPSTTEGVGLGLSIVIRIANIHQAQVGFGRASPQGGLSVKIRFPAASSK